MGVGKMPGSRSAFGRWRRHGLVPLLLVLAGLSGCARAGNGPSPESEYLDQIVVPRLLQWWNSNSTVFPLHRMLGSRGFEQLCILPEENFLSAIEDELNRPIKSYHSSFGMGVRGGHVALIAIKGEAAHSALISLSDMDMPLYHENRCKSLPMLQFSKTAGKYSVDLEQYGKKGSK